MSKHENISAHVFGLASLQNWFDAGTGVSHDASQADWFAIILLMFSRVRSLIPLAVPIIKMKGVT